MDDDERTNHETESRAIASSVLYPSPEPVSPLLQHCQVLLKLNDELCSLRFMKCYCFVYRVMLHITSVGKL